MRRSRTLYTFEWNEFVDVLLLVVVKELLMLFVLLFVSLYLSVFI